MEDSFKISNIDEAIVTFGFNERDIIVQSNLYKKQSLFKPK